jgi:predicted extracellular nuclease
MSARILLAMLVAVASLALPGAASAASTSLVINEVDYDQPSTDTAEFLELKNVSGGSIHLDPYSVELVNGNAGGAAIVQTIDLPAVDLPAGEYYVICANAANTPNCDLDVAPDTNLIQNGEPDAIGLRQGTTLVDALSYEGNSGAPYTEGSGAGLADTAATGEGLSRCADGADTDVNNADFLLRAITPGVTNSCPPPVIPFGACGDDLESSIHAIQGNGAASSAAGEQRVVEGVVVGDYQAAGGLGGFFVQEEDADADADPQTSEGLFVASLEPVAEGDVVRVRGTVRESFTRTQLSEVTRVEVCPSEGEVTATEAALPVSSADEWEPLEGMLVTFPQPLTISEYFGFDQFNETVLTDGRQFQPTHVYEPGSDEAAALAASNALGRITLDDGRNAQNPDPALHPDGDVFDLEHRFRGGDTVTGVTGVVDFAFSRYRIQPTADAEYTAVNERPAEPEDVGGNVQVASFNVLNYFTTLREDDEEARGADTPEEFERQRAKIISAIAEIDADVVGLIEIENNDAALQDLVDGLNEATEPGRYASIDTGVIGTDAIKVAFVYQPARVTPVGDHAILDSTVDPDFLDDYNRPALAQTFRDNETGGVFTTVVNHLKSKGSDCEDVDDPDTGDGSGNCNLTRLAAAEALVDWLKTDPTGSGDDDFLIIGDLNAYAKEDPIDALLAGGYTDLLREFEGEDAYSYVFDGQLGYLDHALASSGLVDEVTGATVWHINADEPDILDYDMTFKKDAQDALYEPNAYRSSDHDPVIVGLDVCDEIAPTIDVSVTPDSLWPPNHKYRTVQATVTVADDVDAEPEVELVSVTSSEPDNAPDGGDGNTTDDAVTVDDDTFRLRAERDGNGSGRVYTITYEVTDDCGNSATDSATVTVPLGR